MISALAASFGEIVGHGGAFAKAAAGIAAFRIAVAEGGEFFGQGCRGCGLARFGLLLGRRIGLLTSGSRTGG